MTTFKCNNSVYLPLFAKVVRLVNDIALVDRGFVFIEKQLCHLNISVTIAGKPSRARQKPRANRYFAPKDAMVILRKLAKWLLVRPVANSFTVAQVCLRFQNTTIAPTNALVPTRQR